MLANVISIFLLCSFKTSSCSQTEETSKSRHKPPPLHIPRNTNPAVFTFSSTSTSSQSTSLALFTPSFLNSLNGLQNSTPRSQIKYRLGLNVTTHKLHLSFHDVRDHSPVHRQTHDKPLHPHHRRLHLYTYPLHSPPYLHQNAREHLHLHLGNTNDAVKN